MFYGINELSVVIVLLSFCLIQQTCRNQRHFQLDKVLHFVVSNETIIRNNIRKCCAFWEIFKY